MAGDLELPSQLASPAPLNYLDLNSQSSWGYIAIGKVPCIISSSKTFVILILISSKLVKCIAVSASNKIIWAEMGKSFCDCKEKVKKLTYFF